MAQAVKEILTRLAKGAPGGSGTGVLALLGAAGAFYGLSESVYTVDGGHRAIIFSRLGGIQPDTYSEGLHFRLVSLSNFQKKIEFCL